MARLPSYRAQLPALAEQAPSGPQWLHELKYNGLRIACRIEVGRVKLESPSHQDCTAQFPAIAAAARELPVRSAVLDGEAAVLLANGTTSLETLQQAVAALEHERITYFAFDLLHLDGKEVSELPLERRKQLCEALVRKLPVGSPVRYSQHFDIEGPKLLERACALGAEGIVSKRRDLPHRAGRSSEWLQVRCVKRHVVRGVTITTPERPVYPELGFTKLDLAQLYSDLAERMLPHIARRPLTLVRCEKGVRTPDALRTECKFLRHEPGWHRWVKDPIRRVHIREQKKIGEYLVVDSPEGLVSLIQGGITEIHVWNATLDHLEQPDRIVFDLDPGTDVEWSRVLEAARSLRDDLAALGLQSWPRLTGGKGIHVVVPIEPEHGWDAVYAFARSVAEHLQRRDPAAFTLSFSKHGRNRQILIDYKRNHRAAVAVAAYSTRARPNGAMAVPVSWRELKSSVPPDRWTVRDIRARLARLKADPWQELLEVRQRLGVKRR